MTENSFDSNLIVWYPFDNAESAFADQSGHHFDAVPKGTVLPEIKEVHGRRAAHFEGGVYGNSKWELFRQADLFILPTHSENFGIVVAEALASGTPVVTTMGTPWSELESRRCGWWTEVGTEATVQALRNFLSLTENELEKMGRNGRKLVEEKYSAHKVAEEFVEMYKSIL